MVVELTYLPLKEPIERAFAEDAPRDSLVRFQDEAVFD
jgi:hypothetical protein